MKSISGTFRCKQGIDGLHVLTHIARQCCFLFVPVSICTHDIDVGQPDLDFSCRDDGNNI